MTTEPTPWWERPTLPIEECQDRTIYELQSRNLVVGVFRVESRGFIGIREKFGDEFLFEEYHYDTGPPFGTARPFVALGVVPDDVELTEQSAELFSLLTPHQENVIKRYDEDET